MLVDPNHWFERPLNATCLELACREEECTESTAEFVRILLQAGADPNAVNPITEKSPIHLAMEVRNSVILKALLADSRTDVNAADGHGRTPLHYAMEKSDSCDKRSLQCLKLLLDNPHINLNIQDRQKVPPIVAAAQCGNKVALQMMIDLKGESLDLDSTQEQGEESARCIILKTFPDVALPAIHHVQALEPTIQAKMFQFLYKRQTKMFINHIKDLRSGEGVNGDDGSYTFLQYACKHGLTDVVAALLRNDANPNQTTEKNRRPPAVLACCKRHHDILMLFLTLLPNSNFDVNATDMKGNTSLHYAAKNGDLNSVLALLSFGADIRIKNVFDKPPLPARAVENLLNQCLRSDGTHYPEEDDYRLLFDYGMIVPDKVHKSSDNFNTEVISLASFEAGEFVQFDALPNEGFGNLKAEMDFLFYLSHSTEHRPLLKHPIITSFLHLKWKQISLIYYVSLALSLLFTLLLNTFIIIQINNHMNNSTLSYEAEDMIPNCTISNKTQDMIPNCTISNKTEDMIPNFTDKLNSIPKILTILLALFLLLMILRELILFILSPKHYMTNSENLVDLGLIITTVLTLFVDIPNGEWRKTVTVLAILLSWIESAQITGRLPIVSCSIEMLKTVSLTFLKFMIWYSVLIIAFGICFFVLFHDVLKQDNKFESLGFSLFKTFIMMTGEFNSDDEIPFKETTFVAYIIFILFVFFIAIVLLNLLTGLAVKDTEIIQHNAQILSLTSRIRIIFEIESILVQGHKFISKCHFLKPLVTRFENWILDISLFPPSVPVKHVCVLPNKGTEIFSPNEKCLNYKMDLDILGDAMNIIGNKSKISDIEDIKTRLDAIETYHIKNKNEMDRILELLGQRQDK